MKKPQEKQPVEMHLYPMRINKYLAHKKHSTRRGADELIQKGQVFLNGRPAVLGDKVIESDVIDVHFRGKQKTYVYYAGPLIALKLFKCF